MHTISVLCDGELQFELFESFQKNRNLNILRIGIKDYIITSDQ